MPGRSSATPHPSATVVLLRDDGGKLELLLVRRARSLSFHGGAWVFPGGRIDPGDYDAAPSRDVAAAARRAAVREVREETGLEITPEGLVPIAHWTTPEGMPRRFATWFFVCDAGGGAVQIDGGEIRDFRWLRPGDALAAQSAGRLALPPPTFVTVQRLAAYPSAAVALAHLKEIPAETFVPRIHAVPGGICALYEGDAGYQDGDVAREGPRHRLWTLESGWRYERSV